MCQTAIRGRRRRPAPCPADDARCAALRYDQRRQSASARRQDRLAHAGQGGRHHHPRRHPDQRGAAQPGAGGGRVADGPHQCRDRDRRRQGAQMEGAAARSSICRICAGSSRLRATMSSPPQASRRTCSVASKDGWYPPPAKSPTRRNRLSARASPGEIARAGVRHTVLITRPHPLVPRAEPS